MNREPEQYTNTETEEDKKERERNKKEREMVKARKGIHPTTVTTASNMLHLGSYIFNDGSRSCDSDQDRVTFSDPCSACGSKRRRLSLLHSQSFKLRKKRKKSILPYLLRHSSSSSSLTVPSSLFNSTTTSPSSALDSLPRTNPFTLISPENNNIDSVKNSPPRDSFHQPSLAVNPYLDRFNSFSGSCSGTPSRSVESSPANAQLPPRPPTPLRRTVSDITSPPPQPYLSRFCSFTGSSSDTPLTSAEASPANAPLPPRSPLHRSISDLTSRTVSNGGGETSTLTTESDQTNGGDGESPNEMIRWKKVEESLGEMKNFVNNFIQEQQLDKEEEPVISPKPNCECGEKRTVAQGKEGGDAYRMFHNCCCGRSYHIIISILPAAAN